MQYQLIAFTPFAVMGATAMVAGSLSLVVKLVGPKVKGSPVVMNMAPRPSAEILYFPVAKARLTRSMTLTVGEAGRGTAA